MKQAKQTAIVFLVSLVWVTVGIEAQSNTWIVSSDGDFDTVEEAISSASNGDSIEVYGGTHSAILVDKSIKLIGIDNPIIDGDGEGTVVTIVADDVHMSGFTIRNSGTNISHGDSGLKIQAKHVAVEANILENVLFGIYFTDAQYSIAQNNLVRGYEFEPAKRGDGISVYSSSNVRLEANHVSMTGDIFVWYADDITIIDNTFTDARYGLHVWFSDNAWIESNHFVSNSVGAYLIHSTGLRMISNDLSYNRGSSGYGIALKEMDDVILSDNWLINNRVGLYLDNSPSLYEGVNQHTRNVFAYNDIGIVQLPSVERNVFTGNIFLENIQQVSVHGRGTLQGNTWTVNDLGNYWSDYVGYDADTDGIGDVAYRAEDLFDSLTDEHPNLRFFIYSPASQAIDLAASAFPSLRPEPRLVDAAPMINYTIADDRILLDSNTTTSKNPIPYLLLVIASFLPFLTQFEFKPKEVKSCLPLKG